MNDMYGDGYLSDLKTMLDQSARVEQQQQGKDENEKNEAGPRC